MKFFAESETAIETYILYNGESYNIEKYRIVEKADLKELIEIGYCTQTTTMLNFVNKMEKKYLPKLNLQFFKGGER